MYQAHAIIRGVYGERECEDKDKVGVWLGLLLIEYNAVINCADMRSGCFHDNNTGKFIGHYVFDKE